MPRFSLLSRERLETCDSRLQALFEVVVLSFDCTVLEGHRGADRQAELYESGDTQVRVSKHNSSPSMAVDVVAYPVVWEDYYRHYYFGGYVLGVASVMGIPLRWGGDWDRDKEVVDQTFNDLVHFEIVEDYV